MIVEATVAVRRKLANDTPLKRVQKARQASQIQPTIVYLAASRLKTGTVVAMTPVERKSLSRSVVSQALFEHFEYCLIHIECSLVL